MTTYLLSSIAGRVAVVLCAFAILLPYVLRRSRLSRTLGFAQDNASPYVHRLWPHFWLGYLILAFSIVHAGTVMAAMARANQAGLWAATVALFLLVLAVMFGLSLKDVGLTGRTLIRRLHFWTMAAVVVSLAVHLWLNAR
jgi:hypothetical protein